LALSVIFIVAFTARKLLGFAIRIHTQGNQAAQQPKLYALTIDNLNGASDFTIANLYHYFQPAPVAMA
jgi:hypothetical protein